MNAADVKSLTHLRRDCFQIVFYSIKCEKVTKKTLIFPEFKAMPFNFMFCLSTIKKIIADKDEQEILMYKELEVDTQQISDYQDNL